MTRSLYEARSEAGVAYYPPVMVGPETIARRATSPAAAREVLKVLAAMEPDDYSRYLGRFLETGLDRFGESWAYADICTVLLACAELVQPQTYLEIGVRRGRSMAMVARTSPRVRLVGFDLWMADYAGMENPGPDFVRAEMKRVGHTGPLTLVSGDSHETVPRHFAENPHETYELITVDGDHSYEGALADLRTVIPRLALGGVLVFDDLVHPAHPWLREVWDRAVAEDGGLLAGSYVDVGFGVGFAVRVRERPAPGRLDKIPGVRRVAPVIRKVRRAVRKPK